MKKTEGSEGEVPFAKSKLEHILINLHDFLINLHDFRYEGGAPINSGSQIPVVIDKKEICSKPTS